MINRCKKIICMVCIFLVAPLFHTHAQAHNSSQKGTLAEEYIAASYGTAYGQYFVGGESVGWSINENQHLASKGIVVTFKRSDLDKIFTEEFLESNDIFKLLEDAAKLWSPYVSFQKVDDTAVAHGTVRGINDPSLYTFAAIDSTSPDTDGHLSGKPSWVMVINVGKVIEKTTLAHEVGHVIGLNDLYQHRNYNRIMCGFEDMRLPLAPSYMDIKGAEVILGEHTTHPNRAYAYHGVSSGTKQHAIACTYCHGFIGNGTVIPSLTPCIYTNGNNCAVCNEPRA